MTEHSIKELQRQFDAAASRLNDAKVKFSIAQSALKAAIIEKGEADFAAKGITPGTKVVDRRGLVAGIYMYHESNRWNVDATPCVHKIKKDGTAHATQRAYSSGWRLPE